VSHLNDQIIRLYDTVFDRAPDAGGLEFWNEATHRGLTMDGMADLFITAPEFAATYGQPDNLSFVREMYANVLDRPGEADGVAFWTRVLNEGLADRGDVVNQFSESPEHIAQMAAPTPDPVPVPARVSSPGVTHKPGFPETYGTPGNDTIHGADEAAYGAADTTLAFGGDDVVFGHGGNDALNGGPGNDTLHGGEGNDMLIGEAGGDRMDGGPGADVFLYRATPQISNFGSTIDEIGGDYITGFEVGTDLLDFRPLHLAFRGQAAFEANGQAQLRYVDEFTPRMEAGAHYPGSTQVYLDVNGDGTADASMTIEHRALTDASFLI
jgi:hypothetical protein